jgi:sulfate adenylyltransferase subunit 1 (EFTu-like GTPase family)
VTARIKMSATGTSTTETAVWIVSAKNGASAQNQLTAEIANGCP